MAQELVVTTKPNPLRRRGVEAAIGTLAGLVLACVAGPQFVSLWYKPPSGTAFNCGGEVSEALGYFVKVQLLAGVLGGSIILLLSFLFRRTLRKRREARVAPSA